VDGQLRGQLAVEIEIHHGCVERHLLFNITNIVGFGNLVSFDKVKQQHHLVWAFGTKYYNHQSSYPVQHPRMYRSLIQVLWKSAHLCQNSSITMHIGRHSLINPSLFHLEIKRIKNIRILKYQFQYQGRIHMFADPKLEFHDLTFQQASTICKDTNSTLFYYHSEKELTYVHDWLIYYGTKGAPGFTFTSIMRSKVSVESMQ